MVLDNAFQKCIKYNYNRIMDIIVNEIYEGDFESELLKIHIETIVKIAYDYGKYIGGTQND